MNCNGEDTHFENTDNQINSPCKIYFKWKKNDFIVFVIRLQIEFKGHKQTKQKKKKNTEPNQQKKKYLKRTWQ